jgi:hypothetical protein
MEPEGSLPHSQMPATCPYPEPVHVLPLEIESATPASSRELLRLDLFTLYFRMSASEALIASYAKVLMLYR